MMNPGAPWTLEDAAVAADAAMDRGTPFADLWRYLVPDVVQALAGCPQLFSVFVPDPNNPRAWAWAGGISRIRKPWSGTRAYTWSNAWSGTKVKATARLAAGMWLRAIPGVWVSWEGTWTHVGEDGA